MRKDGTLLLTLLALALAGLGIMSLAARGAAADYYEYAARPLSAAQMVMASRTTAPADGRGVGRLWVGVGLAATIVVVTGGALLAMNGGSRFLKEYRLTRRTSVRRQARVSASLPALPSLPHLEDTT